MYIRHKHIIFHHNVLQRRRLATASATKCSKTLNKCTNIQIKTPSPKQKTAPNHHPLIIKTSQHHHHTSRRLHRNMPNTSPAPHWKTPRTPSKTNKTTTKQHRDITKKNRDKTETRPNLTETRQRQNGDSRHAPPHQCPCPTPRGWARNTGSETALCGLCLDFGHEFNERKATCIVWSWKSQWFKCFYHYSGNRFQPPPDIPPPEIRAECRLEHWKLLAWLKNLSSRIDEWCHPFLASLHLDMQVPNGSKWVLLKSVS